MRPEERSPSLSPSNVFHGEEGLAVDVSHVIHAANVWDENLAGGANFIAKALEQISIMPSAVGKELQRDGLAQRKVVGAV